MKPLFTIDRLILLAPPVQEATAHLVHSPVFKRVYTCYSTADLVQIADPQGIYKEMQAHEGNLPLFSKRTYTPGLNLTQAQIVIRDQGPSHRDFISPHFFGQLPQIIKLLDSAQALGKEHVTINVPFQGQAPHLIENTQEPIHQSSNKHQRPLGGRKQ